MSSIIAGKQNTLTQTFTVATVSGVLTATLVIGGETAFDFGFTDLIRIKDTTTNTTFGLSAGTTFSNTFASGLPTFTWVLPNVPTGTASDDTILVYLNVTEPQADTLLLQYQKA